MPQPLAASKSLSRSRRFGPERIKAVLTFQEMAGTSAEK
jgi:hypothetical protein